MNAKRSITVFVVAVIRLKNRYLLTKRAELDPEDPKDFLGKWQLPGGGINFGETAEEAIKREVKEEVGFEIKIIKVVPYIINAIRSTWQGVGIVFFCRPINDKPRVKLNSEAKSYGWFNFNEVMKLQILPGGKQAIRKVEGEFFRKKEEVKV